MGDGQHVWAAAEWILMLRNCFVYEEELEQTLLLFSGVPASWLHQDKKIVFGPTRTSFGPIRLSLTPQPSQALIEWEAQFRDVVPRMEIHLAGFTKRTIGPDEHVIVMRR